MNLDYTDPFSATVDAVDDAIPNLNPFITSSGDVYLPIPADVPTFTTRTPTHEMFVGKVPFNLSFQLMFILPTFFFFYISINYFIKHCNNYFEF